MSKAKGRPTGARDRLRNNFLAALADDFKANGVAAIEAMRVNDPSAYVRAIASLMPKEMDLNHKVSPLEHLTDDQLESIVDTTERFLSERGGQAPIGDPQGNEQAEGLSPLH